MTTFAFIHGGGDVGWSWHLVEAELRARGHHTVAPDLPIDNETATLQDYADTVVQALGDRSGELVVVGHSYGAFTAPLVAEQLGADLLVLLAGMVPSPGEAPDDWWADTGYGEAAAEQAKQDGGLTGNDDPYISFLHDVPRDLAEEAMKRGRDESSAAGSQPWPLETWPDVPTKFILCKDDRFFPADFFRRLVPERLGITPDEMPGSHCVALSRPKELAELLLGYLA